MLGLSKIQYKGKEIIYIDYSVAEGSKEKSLEIIINVTNEFIKHPPKSVLSMVNGEKLTFDKDVLVAMKESQNKILPYQKKNAILGIKPIQKAAYNFVLAITADKFTKICNSELEAKEWLVMD